jgi:hypothetical protein
MLDISNIFEWLKEISEIILTIHLKFLYYGQDSKISKKITQ